MTSRAIPGRWAPAEAKEEGGLSMLPTTGSGRRRRRRPGVTSIMAKSSPDVPGRVLLLVVVVGAGVGAGGVSTTCDSEQAPRSRPATPAEERAMSEAGEKTCVLLDHAAGSDADVSTVFLSVDPSGKGHDDRVFIGRL